MERACAGRPVLLFLLLISLSFAQYGTPCPQCKMTDIYLSAGDSTVRAVLIANALNYPEGRTPEELQQLREAYEESLREEISIPLIPSSRLGSSFPVQDAPIFFYYNKFAYDSSTNAIAATQTPIRGCYPATTNQDGIASCRLDPSIFRGKCVKIFADYPGNQSLNPASSTITICDKDADAFSAMAAALSGLSLDQPLCLVGFIIIGLFIASMFFSGRSPLSLLDITTPLLPKPKSISYSGLTYGSGYVRMARELDKIKELTDAHLGMHLEQIKRELLSRGKTMGEINQILRLAAGNPAMAYLALRALRGGHTLAEATSIAKLRPGPANTKDLAEAGRWLNELKKKAKEKDLALEAVWIRVSSEVQKKEIWYITGKVPPAIGKVRDALLDSKISPFRYVLPERIRDQIKVGIGAAFFAGRSTTAITKQLAALAAEKVVGAPVIRMKPEEKEVRQFALMDIRSRISQLYRMQMQEAKTNAAMYLVKRILEEKGVKLYLSERELLELGKIEILRRMNLERNAAASAADKKIRDILSMGIPIEEKFRLLIQLALREGITFDKAGAENFLNRLLSIDKDQKKSDFEKFKELHDYLRNYTDVKNFRTDAFYPWVGRPSLRYIEGGITKYDDTWTFLFLRSYFEQNEPGRKQAGLDYAAKLLWLRLVNEMWGLLPSTTKGLGEPQKSMMSRAEAYLKSMLTDEGHKALKGRHVFELLYNPEIAGYKVEYKEKIFALSELAREFGPNPAHWKLDVRGYWRVLVPGSAYLSGINLAKTSVMEQAYGAMERAHVSRALPPGIDPRLKGDELQMAIARQMFYNRIRSLVGTNYPDAYHTANSEYRFLSSAYGAFRERYAQIYGKTPEMKKDSSWVTDDQVKKMIEKGISLDDLHKFVWIRTREGNYIPYTEGREGIHLKVSDAERIVNGRLTVNMGGRWMEFDPYHVAERMKKENIELPAYLVKEQKELLKSIRDSPMFQDGLIKRREISDELRDRISHFSHALTRWAGTDRQDVAAHILLGMCKEANDFSALQNSGLISIRPVKDTEFIGFRNILQKIAQPFAKGMESAAMSAFLPQIKDIQNLVMHSEYFRSRSAEFSAMLAGGDPTISKEMREGSKELILSLSRYRAIWDETITRDPRGNSSSLGPHLNFASLYHHGPALHPPPFTVLSQLTGRGFRRMTESLRLIPLSINWVLGAPFILMVRGALTSWYGYPSKHDKTYHPLHPYEMTASRTLEGFRSLFDPFYAAIDFSSGTFRKVASLALSPIQPFINPAGIASDMLNSLAEQFKTPEGMTSYMGRGIRYAADLLKQETGVHEREEFRLPYFVERSGIRERLTGQMTMREYGGKNITDGVVRTHEDHAWIYKNINVIWNVNTNPGISYLDFNYALQSDPRLATHLISGSRFSSFFAQDEYLHKQANLGIIQREVSPYELAEVREEELRHYGPRSNRLWGFLSPINFFYNNPLFPLSLVTYNFLTRRGPEMWTEWREKAEERERLRYADLHAPPKTYMYGMHTGTASDQLRYTTLQPSEAAAAETALERYIRKAGTIAHSVFSLKAQYVSCTTCRSPMQRGGTCPVCTGRSLIFLNARKPWSPYGRR